MTHRIAPLHLLALTAFLLAAPGRTAHAGFRPPPPTAQMSFAAAPQIALRSDSVPDDTGAHVDPCQCRITPLSDSLYESTSSRSTERYCCPCGL